MKVFVTGATGALGQATVPRLVTAGHEVRGVARGDEKASWLRAHGAEPVELDLFDAHAVGDAVHGSDAVAHLATNVPPLKKFGLPSAWKMHNRLRAEATPLLVNVAVSTGAQMFVKESVCFFYVDAGDALIDESAAMVSGKLVEPTLIGERAVERVTDNGGRGVVLRFGFFYGPSARGLDESLKLARVGSSTIAGKRDGYVPSIHLDDAADAVVAALERAPAGVYNVCDEPVTKGEYLRAFADAFELRRTPRPIPSAALRISAGSPTYLAGSQRTSNARFKAATGWEPMYRSVIEGWPAVAQVRRNQGA